MKPLVMKFGGTSVRSHEQRERAARRVCEAKAKGFDPVVVVSAMGRKGEPYATDTLIALAEEIDPDIAPREKDMLMACGEIISTVIMAHMIRHIGGLRTVALTGGQAGIITDRNFGSARIIEIQPDRLLRSLREGSVPVVAGFQGVAQIPEDQHEHGSITTLGRGGSDTTASALGAAVKAVEVQIFSDVPGIMTADPRMVPEARTLRTITYEEICEMAHQGARVLHPRSAEIAMDYGIPLRVLPTMGDSEGTLIVREPSITREREHGVTGITNSPPVVPLSMAIADAESKPAIEYHVLSRVAEADVSVYLTSDTPKSVNFVVSRECLDRAVAALDGVQVPTSLRDDAPNASEKSLRVVTDIPDEEPAAADSPIYVRVHGDCSIVSVIGRGLRRVPGIMARVSEALEQSGIRILQVAGSDNSISCLISYAHVEQAVKHLHSKFHLHELSAEATID
ncbi:MAG: aspartate kinase [Armatimonadota bacterium]